MKDKSRKGESHTRPKIYATSSTAKLKNQEKKKSMLHSSQASKISGKPDATKTSSKSKLITLQRASFMELTTADLQGQQTMQANFNHNDSVILQDYHKTQTASMIASSMPEAALLRKNSQKKRKAKESADFKQGKNQKRRQSHAQIMSALICQNQQTAGLEQVVKSPNKECKNINTIARRASASQTKLEVLSTKKSASKMKNKLRNTNKDEASCQNFSLSNQKDEQFLVPGIQFRLANNDQQESGPRFHVKTLITPDTTSDLITQLNPLKGRLPSLKIRKISSNLQANSEPSTGIEQEKNVTSRDLNQQQSLLFVPESPNTYLKSGVQVKEANVLENITDSFVQNKALEINNLIMTPNQRLGSQAQPNKTEFLQRNQSLLTFMSSDREVYTQNLNSQQTGKKRVASQTQQDQMLTSPIPIKPKVGAITVLDAASLTLPQTQSLACLGPHNFIAHSVLTQHQVKQMKIQKSVLTPSQANSPEKKIREANNLEMETQSQEKIFKNFVKLYSKQIQAAQLGIQRGMDTQLSPTKKEKEKKSRQLSPSSAFSPLTQHGSKIQIKDQQTTPRIDQMILSSDRQYQKRARDTSEPNYVKNMAKSVSKPQLFIQSQSKILHGDLQPNVSVFTTNKIFFGQQNIGSSGFLSRDNITYSPNLNGRVCRLSARRKTLSEKSLSASNNQSQGQLSDAILVTPIHQRVQQLQSLKVNLSERNLETTLPNQEIHAFDMLGQVSNLKPLSIEDLQPNSQPTKLDEGPLPLMKSKQQYLDFPQGHQLINTVDIVTTKAASGPQKSRLKHVMSMANQSIHSRVEIQASVQDLSLEIEQLCTDKPAVYKGSNIFGVQTGKNCRPKTASSKQSQLNVSHPVVINNKKQIGAHQQAYGGANIPQKHQSSATTQNFHQTTLQTQGADLFLKKGDSIISTKMHQGLITDAFLQNGFSEQQDISMNQCRVIQKNNEKQFKIKQGKNKRGALQSSSSGNKIFSNQTSKHRKLSAVRKPQKVEGLAQNVGVEGTTPFLNYLEEIIQQQKIIEDHKVDEAEKEEDKKSVNPLIKIFSEYKNNFNQQNSQQEDVKDTRLFEKNNYVAHHQGTQPTSVPLQTMLGQFQQQNLLSQQPTHEYRQLFKQTIDTKTNGQMPVLTKQQITLTTSSEPSFQQLPQHRSQIAIIPAGRLFQSSHVSAQATSFSTNQQDDVQTLKCQLAICRSVQARAEDIHLIRQSMDVKLRKIRNVNIELFDELKGREVARLSKENALFASLIAMKQTESTVTKRQLIKNCKKIFKVFWNVIEAEEEAQDLTQMNRYRSMYVASELNLLECLTEKGEKVQIFKRCHAIQAKMIEALFREKDFELNFCMALGVQKARQTFLNEVMRTANIFIELIEQNSGMIAQIKRALRGMSDAQNHRRIKMVTVSAKAARIFDFLSSQNQYVKDVRLNYLQSYAKKLAQSTTQAILNSPGNNTFATRKYQIIQKNRLQIKQMALSSKKEKLTANSRNSIEEVQGVKQVAQNSLKIKIFKAEGAQIPPNNLETDQNIKSSAKILAAEYGNLSSTLSQNSIKKELKDQKLKQRSVLCLRKYKWQHLYSREQVIGFNRSEALRMKDHFKTSAFPFLNFLSEILRTDLNQCMEQSLYKNYSMKKGSEHHFTIIIESRVLKLQKLARCFYRVRTRAAKTIQSKLRQLIFKHDKKQVHFAEFEKLDQRLMAITQPTETNLLQSKQPCGSAMSELQRELKHRQLDHNEFEKDARQKLVLTGQRPSESPWVEEQKQHRLSVDRLPFQSSTGCWQQSHCTPKLQQLKASDLSRPVSLLHLHPAASPQLQISSRKESQQQRQSDGFATTGKQATERQLLQSSHSHLSQGYKHAQKLSLHNDSEQQGLGEKRDLRMDLWNFSEAKNIVKIILLQRATRKYLAKLFYSNQRVELLNECRQAKLYSVNARQAQKEILFKKVKEGNLPSAKLDSRKLELTHGLDFHRLKMTEYIALRMRSASVPQDYGAFSKQDFKEKKDNLEVVETQVSIDGETWRDFWKNKLQADFATMLREKSIKMQREHISLRRQLFLRQLCRY